MPPKRLSKIKPHKPRRSDADILVSLAKIAEEVEEEFRFSPEYYKSMTCRMIEFLMRERPRLFKKRDSHETQ